MITFKANAFFLMGSHVRVSVPFVLVFVWTEGTLEPNIFMSKHMSVVVPFVFKTSTTSIVFAHVIELFLVCDLMLFQSAFEWVALTTVLTNKTKITVEVHMLVKRRLCCKFLVTLLTLNNPMVLPMVFIKFFNRAERIYTNFAPYGAGVFSTYQGIVGHFHR